MGDARSDVGSLQAAHPWPRRSFQHFIWLVDLGVHRAVLLIRWSLHLSFINYPVAKFSCFLLHSHYANLNEDQVGRSCET